MEQTLNSYRVDCSRYSNFPLIFMCIHVQQKRSIKKMIKKTTYNKTTKQLDSVLPLPTSITNVSHGYLRKQRSVWRVSFGDGLYVTCMFHAFHELTIIFVRKRNPLGTIHHINTPKYVESSFHIEHNNYVCVGWWVRLGNIYFICTSMRS